MLTDIKVNESIAENTRGYNGTVNCDQKCWIKTDLQKMLEAAWKLKETRLDTIVFDATIEALMESTLIEICDRVLNLRIE